ncbi:MAG: metallophosphoesterase family protein [Rhodospirillales bacterium]|jgi:predicted phosphodiesterase|nr:metallophosphoesterase family protein [Rhodospirillales bacterium]MBT4627482.1 metallophosphoesterase family protein [Rhodospirillales bacterium]MBT5350982.1 metallophosphoesterase family protein [Rhodospirillales bacterium]MBT5520598.1 metallophosphoesterase family protein [Rhodospirillales bacterium]MBT6111367.1 metallophosphoesterase family protein [Rhodospirillales bacterium]
MFHLGKIDEPVFIFGGPYSNIQATEKVLTIAHGQGFSADRIICTGDVVAYCANPAETTAMIRDWGIHVVMGNCEESLGFEREDCGCGFEEDSACDMLSRQWFDFATRRITSDDKAWMQTLPRQLTFEMAGRRLAVIHGSLSDISGWVFKSTDDQTKITELDLASCDGIIAGHCGLPFISTTSDQRLWLNAGVIGMPANDGTSRGWYSILEPCDGGIRAHIHPFDYDHESAASAMRDERLASGPGGYANGLTTGLWPNMDVLPDAERQLQGRAIESQSYVWAAPRDQRLTA